MLQPSCLYLGREANLGKDRIPAPSKLSIAKRATKAVGTSENATLVNFGSSMNIDRDT